MNPTASGFTQGEWERLRKILPACERMSEELTPDDCRRLKAALPALEKLVRADELRREFWRTVRQWALWISGLVVGVAIFQEKLASLFSWIGRHIQ